MIGRRVRVLYYGDVGEVLRWEPLGEAMADAFLRLDDGRECWFASHDLRPTDGLGPLPDRHEVQREAAARHTAVLRKVRDDLIRGWFERWPGLEWGKAIVGMALNEAIRGPAA